MSEPTPEDQQQMDSLVIAFMFGPEGIKGNIEGIKKFLSKESDVKVSVKYYEPPYKGDFGGSLLSYLVIGYRVHKNIDVIQLMIDYGADPTLKAGSKNKSAIEYNDEMNLGEDHDSILAVMKPDAVAIVALKTRGVPVIEPASAGVADHNAIAVQKHHFKASPLVEPANTEAAARNFTAVQHDQPNDLYPI